ncbi:Asp-tRNA(Asn)/Glu-tRNA(Gln) amidotransferase GatCAB subunit B, partial [Actinomadura adrarensis]
RRVRVKQEWGLSDLELRDVVNAGALDLIEETIKAGSAPTPARKWWMNELSRRATEQGVELADLPITPAQVARVQEMVDAGELNDKLARQVFTGVLDGEGTPDEVVTARDLKIVSDDGELESIIDQVIADNPDVADKVRGGKVNAVGALIGPIMKATKGKADAGRARQIILEKLGVA